MKKLTIGLMALVTSLSTVVAHAAEDDVAPVVRSIRASTGAPTQVQYSRDANYIYIKEPLRVVLDQDQQRALGQGLQFIQKKLEVINQNPGTDPDGDLKALTDATTEFGSKLNQLVQLSGQLYGDVAGYGMRLFEAAPSGIIVFGGAEYDKNVFKFLSGGGSIMMGAVLVPMRVQRITIKNPREVITYTTWDSSLVIVPAVNVGPGVSTTGGGKSVRFGVGLIWGELNKASELVGLTGGGSVTLAAGQGVNLKFLGLKNFAKSNFVNNVILMVGIESGQLGAANTKIPFIQMNAESHFNLSWIYDAGATFGGISKFTSGVANKLSDGALLLEK